jgi:hypothetical protein
MNVSYEKEVEDHPIKLVVEGLFMEDLACT